MVKSPAACDGRSIPAGCVASVVFDTFLDRRHGVAVYTNPLGALGDFQITNEGNHNRDCDRTHASGQVVDPDGRAGWYPHEGGLMEYRVAIRFGQEPHTMPEGWSFGRVSAVATDSSGDVYVFHRGDAADPIVVFDAEGTYQRSFGVDLDFGNEHGLRIDRHDNVWVTDNGNHRVMKLSTEGEVLMTLGRKGQAGTSDDTFDRPADIAFGPNDELYVADGYGNSRVVKYDAEGNFVKTWGTPGSGPGEFDLVHGQARPSRPAIC